MSGQPVPPAVRVLAWLWVALIALELAALCCWLAMGGPWYDLLAWGALVAMTNWQLDKFLAHVQKRAGSP